MLDDHIFLALCNIKMLLRIFECDPRVISAVALFALFTLSFSPVVEIKIMQEACPCSSFRIKPQLSADKIVIVRHVQTMLITGSAVMMTIFLHLINNIIIYQILDKFKIFFGVIRMLDRIF